jgi:hypothetical protein
VGRLVRYHLQIAQRNLVAAIDGAESAGAPELGFGEHGHRPAGRDDLDEFDPDAPVTVTRAPELPPISTGLLANT